jgi:hypothetical protein
MNNRYFWVEVIPDNEDDRDYSVPFYPQEYEEDKDDMEEWGLLLD